MNELMRLDARYNHLSVYLAEQRNILLVVLGLKALVALLRLVKLLYRFLISPPDGCERGEIRKKLIGHYFVRFSRVGREREGKCINLNLNLFRGAIFCFFFLLKL